MSFRIIWIILGSISLALGVLGAVLPFLPTVPFLLFTAYCYAKSSERLHRWFEGTQLYQRNLKSFVEHKAMCRKTKVRILTMITLVMALGFFFMRNVPVARWILIAVCIFHVLYFIWGIQTLKEEE